ncbi:MAG: DUF4397 domain-containing protein [Burkholderiales bacterium]|nr:DUF4397 domain-containing protein [Burkholderiales bacterium]MDE2454469.1 DUF4397 domain-containing protein [Burkholderiales bacterium]
MTRSFVARLGTAALMALAALMLAGCLGKSSSSSAQLRVINLATGSDTANVAVSLSNGSDAYSFPAVANAINNGGTMSGYTGVNAVGYNVDLVASGTSGSTGALATRIASFGSGDHYTGVVWGPSNNLQFATLQEDDVSNTLPSAGYAAVRVLNATGTTGSINVYLTQDTTDPSGATVEVPLNQATPIVSAVAGGAVSSFKVVPQASNYRLRVTDPYSNVLLDTPSVNIGSQQYLTIAVTSSTTNGVVTNASLIAEQGAYTQLLTAAAVPGRLRIAAGVEQAGVVSVSVDGTPFGADSPSPLVGQYDTIAAGAHTISVSVKLGTGAIQSTTQVSQSIVNGGDYSLLVWGPAASPTVTLNQDDNSLPASGNFKIRVVNGSMAAGTVALTDNSVAISNGTSSLNAVTVGSFSPAINAAQDLNALLSVRSIGSSTPINTWTGTLTTPLQLPAGAVYSVFVLGGITNSTGVAVPVATLVRDR